MRKYFTITQANKSLVLVRPIVEDIVLKRKKMILVKKITNRLIKKEYRTYGLSVLKNVSRSITHNLEELELIGCYLKDFEPGVIDFPSILDGRAVFLTWNPTEKQIGYWHEIVHNFDKKQLISLSNAY